MGFPKIYKMMILSSMILFISYSIYQNLIGMLLGYFLQSFRIGSAYHHISYFDNVIVHSPCDIKEEIIEEVRGKLTNSGNKLIKMDKIVFNSVKELPRKLNETQHDRAIELLESMMNIFEKADITFMITYGTLIGSFMTHDILPWDDDIDIMIKLQDIPKLKYLLRNKSFWKKFKVFNDFRSPPQYTLEKVLMLPQNISDQLYLPYDEDRYHLKITFTDGPKVGRNPWPWPFLDSNIFNENETHIWDPNERRLVIEKKYIYPIIKRPFGGILVPTPYNTLEFLKKRYGKFSCTSHFWDHLHGRKAKVVRSTCENVMHSYPYVCRPKSLNQTVELLLQKGKLLQYYTSPEITLYPESPYSFN